MNRLEILTTLAHGNGISNKRNVPASAQRASYIPGFSRKECQIIKTSGETTSAIDINQSISYENKYLPKGGRFACVMHPVLCFLPCPQSGTESHCSPHHASNLAAAACTKNSHFTFRRSANAASFLGS